MTASDKRKAEQQENRQKRENAILDCAYQLFSSQGIENTPITDIAQKAEIGVASLYRYFETKEEIAVRCGVIAWEKQKNLFINRFKGDVYNSKTGLAQIEILLNLFIDLYRTQKQFFVYIYEFDLYARRKNLTPKRLQAYERAITNIQSVAIAAIQKAYIDKSISETLINTMTEEELYISITQPLFCLVQKLSISNTFLEMDSHTPGEKELEFFISLLRKALR